MSSYLRMDQVRVLLRLAGEAREISDAGACPGAHVLQGLSRLSGAEVAIYFAVDRLCTAEPLTVRRYLDHGWPDGERQRVLDYYMTTAGNTDPMLGGMLRTHRRERHVTLRRTDVLTSNAWYRSEFHNELHGPGGLDDVIVSIRFPDGPGDGVSAVVLKRAARAAPFSVEDRDLMHTFMGEADWVFRSADAASTPLVDGLTPREQETLRLLLTDASEKEIAARLGISVHTVHTYVKRLYRRIGVSSRAALMAWSSAGRGKGSSARSA